MKVVSKSRLFFGIVILLLLFSSYFIKIDVDTGDNYQTFSRLTWILVFNSAYVLIAYLLVACFFVFTGFKKLRFV